MKNGEIIFSKESLQAMYAFGRFCAIELKGLEYRKIDEQIAAFRAYVGQNKLESDCISQCGCKGEITNREIIFNVCLTCKGFVYKDWRNGNIIKLNQPTETTTTKRQVTLPRIKDHEIESVFGVMFELQLLKSDLLRDPEFNIFPLDQNYYPNLAGCFNKDPFIFLQGICELISSVPIELFTANLYTLLDNCASESDTLDFNDDIKKGLELLEKHRNERR